MYDTGNGLLYVTNYNQGAVAGHGTVSVIALVSGSTPPPTGSGSLNGISWWLWVVLAVIIVVVVVATTILVRRRKGQTTPPPGGPYSHAQPPSVQPPYTPPPE